MYLDEFAFVFPDSRLTVMFCRCRSGVVPSHACNSIIPLQAEQCWHGCQIRCLVSSLFSAYLDRLQSSLLLWSAREFGDLKRHAVVLATIAPCTFWLEAPVAAGFLLV